MKTKLFNNIGYLAIAQIGTYLLPLITIPYISRTVGLDNYGLVEFATVAMLYFISLVEFSFNTTITRKIAAHKDNLEKVSFLYSSAMYSRLVLFVIGTLIFIVCLFAIPEFKDNLSLILLAYPVVLGWAIYPLFLFQGMQQLKTIAIGNLILKLFSTLLIFIVINNQADYILVATINGGSQLVIGLLILWYVPVKFKGVRMYWPGWRAIKATIYEGRYMFTSDFFNKIYAMGSVFIAGFFVSPANLGLFAAGMKLIVVGKGFIFQPLIGALFPHLNTLYKEDKKRFYAQLNRSFWALLFITSAASIVLMSFSEFIINLLFGKEFIEAAPLMVIMAPILIFSSVVHVFLYQGVLIFKKDKVYLGIIVFGGLLSLILNIMFIPEYGVTGAAYIKLFGEMVIAAISLVMYFRLKNKSFKTS